MRYFEITSGVRIHLSQEEQDIVDKASHDLAKANLNDREQEVARRMVSRGILRRLTKSDKKIYFKKNKDKLRRD